MIGEYPGPMDLVLISSAKRLFRRLGMKRFGFLMPLALVIALTGCSNKTARVEPVPPVLPEMPRLDIPPDPDMFRVVRVIEKYGTRTVNHGLYSEYQKTRKTAGESAFNSDVFYDQYLLDLNENNYWVTVTLRSALRSMRKDPRIREAMSGFPVQAMDLIMKTPEEQTFLLSDSDANGVLDFAGPADQRVRVQTPGDLDLLETMQAKYRWILGIIKRYDRQ